VTAAEMAHQSSKCPDIIPGQPFVLAKVKSYFYHCNNHYLQKFLTRATTFYNCDLPTRAQLIFAK
jgi:hypothetical protein